MRAIPVVKMSGAGNDFLLVDNRAGLLQEGEASELAKAACPRRVSAGADGLILLERSRKAGHDFHMRTFNADGSEAEMCGNGFRCAAVFARQIGAAAQQQRVETLAGSLLAAAAGDGLSARVQMSEPSGLEVKEELDVLGEKCALYCINTGVPHAVEFVEDVAAVDVKRRGSCIRYHAAFKPKGTNANFVQLLGGSRIKTRTYERGVEDETLACGTGAAAAAIAASLAHGYRPPVEVLTAGGDVLMIHFEQQGEGVSAPFLEGPVKTVYKGEFFWRKP